MKGYLFLFFSVFYLASCQLTALDDDQIALSTAHDQNSHIKIELIDIKANDPSDSSGFYVDVLVTSLHPYYDVWDDFSYTMDRFISSSPDLMHEATSIETLNHTKEGTLLEFNEVLIRQFFNETLKQGKHLLNIPFYVKPLYYEQNITFEGLSHDTKQIEKNDFRISSIDVEGPQLLLTASDVHNLKGVNVALLINNEQIHPTFTTTTYNEEITQLQGVFEFTQAIEEPFDLMIRRHKIEEQVWTFMLPTTVIVP
jgi:hypothetical protein